MGRPVVLVTAAALLPFTATAIAARIDGSPRTDFLRGGPSADRIDGRGGSDRIKVDGGGRDSVRCGPGRFDLVNADISDRVASDCETVARVIARDSYRAPAQHATIAEPDSLSWGRTIVVAYQSGRFRDGGAVNTGWSRLRGSRTCSSTKSGSSATTAPRACTAAAATPSTAISGRSSSSSRRPGTAGSRGSRRSRLLRTPAADRSSAVGRPRRNRLSSRTAT